MENNKVKNIHIQYEIYFDFKIIFENRNIQTVYNWFLIFFRLEISIVYL